MTRLFQQIGNPNRQRQQADQAASDFRSQDMILREQLSFKSDGNENYPSREKILRKLDVLRSNFGR